GHGQELPFLGEGGEAPVVGAGGEVAEQRRPEQQAAGDLADHAGHVEPGEDTAHEVGQTHQPDDGDEEPGDLDIRQRDGRQGEVGHEETSSVGGSDVVVFCGRPGSSCRRERTCHPAGGQLGSSWRLSVMAASATTVEKWKTAGSDGSTVARIQAPVSVVPCVSSLVKLGTSAHGRFTWQRWVSPLTSTTGFPKAAARCFSSSTR